MRLALSLLTAALLCAAAGAQQPVKKCPLTRVDRYEFFCEITRDLQDPQNLTTVHGVSLDGCVRACQSRKRCKSFEYFSLTSRCQLFEKYLIEMNISGDMSTSGGTLYDRDCFTTNCNIIKACEATQDSCEYDYRYVLPPGYPAGHILAYKEYSCAYGKTARVYNYSFTDTSLDGTLTACQATQMCISQHGGLGSIDVHFDIPNKKWICRNFEDTTTEYPDLRDERVSRVRYTVDNASVGAGYGYFFEHYYQIPG